MKPAYGKNGAPPERSGGVLKVAFICVVCVVGMLSATTYKDHKVGGGVQFMVLKNHHLQPIFPVELIVNQKEGGIADGLLTCDLYSRVHHVSESDGDKDFVGTVFKCNGGRVFEVSGYSFTPSQPSGPEPSDTKRYRPW